MNFLEFKTRKGFQPKHKNRKLKAPKEKHDCDINGFIKDIKTRRKQIKKMMNGNIDKDYLFEQVIAVEKNTLKLFLSTSWQNTIEMQRVMLQKFFLV